MLVGDFLQPDETICHCAGRQKGRIFSSAASRRVRSLALKGFYARVTYRWAASDHSVYHCDGDTLHVVTPVGKAPSYKNLRRHRTQRPRLFGIIERKRCQQQSAGACVKAPETTAIGRSPMKLLLSLLLFAPLPAFAHGPANDASEFYLCDSCTSEDDFRRSIVAQDPGNPGAFSSFIGNTKSGVLYLIHYRVERGRASEANILTVDRIERQNEATESHFKELVKAIRETSGTRRVE